MTYRGHIKNGTVVLDAPSNLPEGTEVVVSPVAAASLGSQSLLDVFGDLVGSCPELPPDMAKNHDHYLHGQPKK